MKSQIITIEITYNEENYKEPSSWDFESCLDLEFGESVEILEIKPSVNIESE